MRRWTTSRLRMSASCFSMSGSLSYPAFCASAKSRSLRIMFSTNCRLRSGAERYARDGPGRRSISCTTSALVSFFPLYVATTSDVSTVVPAAWGFAAWDAGFSPDGSFDDGEQAVTSAAADSRRTMRRVVIGEEASPAPTRASILGRVREQSGATHEHEERAGDDPHRVHRDIVRRRRATRDEQLVELVECRVCHPEADGRGQQRGPPQSLFAQCTHQQTTQDGVIED